MSRVPKATLYYFPLSIWSAVALLTLEEKGYGKDEIDLKVVDLAKGENYDPSFLRLNPKATVPTLLVPYKDTLSEDMESRYKALTESKAIAEFLDKSRSPQSRTHTTSTAPAPSLSPATVAANEVYRSIVDDVLHSEQADPASLRLLNARDDASLKKLAEAVLPSLSGKQASLQKHIQQSEEGAIRVSGKVLELWKEKLAAYNVLTDVLSKAGKSKAELPPTDADAREAFFKSARQVWEINLQATLQALSKAMIGPYGLGDQFSLADVHLAAWLARIAKLCGATKEDSGKTVVSKIETHIGGGFVLPREYLTEQGRREKGNAESVIGAFWDAVGQRASWKTVYAEGLF